MRHVLLILIPAFALAAAALLSLLAGPTATGWEAIGGLFDREPAPSDTVLLVYRLPRTVAAGLVGANLGVAGAVLQAVFRNPLADPSILGLSSGASLAIVGAMAISTVLGGAAPGAEVLPLAWLAPIGLSGAIAVTLAVLALSWSSGLPILRLALNGIILGALLNAVVLALVLSLDEARTEFAILWLAGSLYGRSLDHVWPVLPWSVLGLGIVACATRPLTLLQFDAQTAAALGLRIAAARVLLIAAGASLAGAAVALAGPVGFVGLLAPHIVQAAWPSARIGQRLWLAAVTGAILVVVGDALGRVAIAPAEIPVGIVTSLIGAPLFAVLLIRRGRG